MMIRHLDPQCNVLACSAGVGRRVKGFGNWRG